MSAINPIGPKPISTPPLQQQAKVSLEQAIRDQMDNLLRIGYFGKKSGVKMVKLPAPPVVPKQAHANAVLQTYVTQMIKNLSKTKKSKSTDEIQEELEHLEKAMDDVDKCLEEISKLPQNQKSGFQSKEDHIRFLLSAVEDYYQEFKESGGDPQDLGLFTAVFYEKISKDAYNKSGKTGALMTFFAVEEGKPVSLFLSDLMFNYFLDLCLQYSKKTTFDMIAPLKSLKKTFEKRPEGIPNIFENMIAVQEEHRRLVCEKLALMSVEFPFSTVMPVILGSKGLRALTQWCWDLYFKYDFALSETDKQTVTQLLKAFSTPLKALFESMCKARLLPVAHHHLFDEWGIVYAQSKES